MSNQVLADLHDDDYEAIASGGESIASDDGVEEDDDTRHDFLLPHTDDDSCLMCFSRWQWWQIAVVCLLLTLSLSLSVFLVSTISSSPTNCGGGDGSRGGGGSGGGGHFSPVHQNLTWITIRESLRNLSMFEISTGLKIHCTNMSSLTIDGDGLLWNDAHGVNVTRFGAYDEFVAIVSNALHVDIRVTRERSIFTDVP